MKPTVALSPSPRLLFVALLVAATVTVSAQERRPEVVRDAERQPTEQAPATAKKSATDREQAIEELLRRLGPALSQRHEDLTSVADDEGVRTTSLQGRFHHALVAHVDAAGNVHYGCVNSEEGARAFLRNGGATE